MKMCKVCKKHEAASICFICKPLYQRGWLRMRDRKNEFNVNLARDPRVFDGALASGLLREEKYGYRNHNLVRLEKPRYVWARTAWDYVTKDDISAAHSKCDH